MECNRGFAKIVVMGNHVKLSTEIHLHLKTFLGFKNQVLNFPICLSSRVPLSYKEL